MPSFRLTQDQELANNLLGGPQRHTCLVGGSRSGKTTVLVRAVMVRALRAAESRHAILRFRGNAARASIALDTLPKVARDCFGISLTEHRQDGFYEAPNKSQIWVGGLDDKDRVEKILGQEYATIYLNECSQIAYQSVLMARTRLAQNVGGLRQRAYYDLNPVGLGHWSNVEFGERKDPLSRKPLASPENYQRMFLNPIGNAENLSSDYLQSLQELPERQRRRFYEGVYVSEVDGALWTYDRLEQVRIPSEDKPEMRRIVVSVDPSGARGVEDVRSDEIGIVVVGQGIDGRAYVLEDLSCRLGPAGWARLAITAFHRHRADCIVAEVNYGKAMVEETIRTQDRTVPIREVHASRGKAIRAEPVSGLYDEKVDLVRHVGRFTDLEDQLCKFTTAGYTGDRSPDRADAMIWAITHLMIKPQAQPATFGRY